MVAIRLPWAPKVRQKDIDQFLYDSRNKFIGYPFAGDHDSLAGLPYPIHEGFNVLKKVIDRSTKPVNLIFNASAPSPHCPGPSFEIAYVH